ncbi:alpha-L-fucosidase [Microtetraspora malaysiensis]|uniref:alpha-L-fucosidase n=1 Tax=Microtetraspora malaysiensis TaxID=161358 RepID=UPI003D92AEDF
MPCFTPSVGDVRAVSTSQPKFLQPSLGRRRGPALPRRWCRRCSTRERSCWAAATRGWPRGLLRQLPLAPPDRLWETCLTMNESWGYVTDEEWKDAGELLRTLVEAVAMGGNLLLNVGPTGMGEFPAEATARLEAFATWMERHEESIRGVRTGLELWQFPGPSTRRSLPEGGERLYLHLVMRPYERLTVRGRAARLVGAALAQGGPLRNRGPARRSARGDPVRPAGPHVQRRRGGPRLRSYRTIAGTDYLVMSEPEVLGK